MIEAEDAFARMGADVMRWQYCAQPPDRNLLFGFGPAEEIRRELLTFWNSVSFFVSYANIEGFRPSWSELEPSGDLQPLDRWLVERTRAFVADATAAYERFRADEVIRLYEAYADDLSNWYIRRSRPRFWDGDEAALRTLWYALVQTLRVLAPVMPFLTEHLWRNLVLDGPESVHLAAWPEVPAPDRALLDEMADVRRVVTLAHQARSASGLKLRQPLRQARRRRRVGRAGARAGDRGRGAREGRRLRPRRRRAAREAEPAGARAAARQGAAHGAAGAAGGRVRGARRRPLPRRGPRARAGRGARRARRPRGLVGRAAEGVTVALDTTLDDELLLEGRVYDLIRLVNSMRKEQGLELTDRIVLTVPATESELVERHGDWIKDEVLAVEIRVDGASDVSIAKAENRE